MSKLKRANTTSVEYTGNVLIPADPNRGYFLAITTEGEGSLVLGGGTGAIPLPLNTYYEPFVAPTSSIQIVSTGKTVVHQTGAHAQLVQRYFIGLDPVLSSYYTIGTELNLVGDFDISFDLIPPIAGQNRAVLGRDGLVGDVLLKNDNRMRITSSTGSAVTFIGTLPSDGKLHNYRITRIGSTVTGYLDGVADGSGTLNGDCIFNLISQDRFNNCFNGVLANIQILDTTTPANNQTYTIGEPTADTETSLEGGDTITYVNIPSANREQYQLNGNIWTNISPLPQELPATIEVV